MKKNYYIDFKTENGVHTSWCENIGVLSERIEEILEYEDIQIDSIVVSTKEVPGSTLENTLKAIRNNRNSKI
jgi:hypothetical protein